MAKYYNVIWIDDEWDKMTEFKDECEDLHIHLQPFSYQKAAMDELDRHPNSWDAVLLDGEIKDKSEHEEPSTKGLLKALMYLAEKHKQIPRFISTGKDKVKDNEMLKDEHIYNKDVDDEKLFDDIRNTIDNIERYKVKSFYADAIEQLESIDAWCCEKILDILEAMHFAGKKIDPLLYYNPLRQTLEYIFRKANKAGIIPNEFIGKEKDDVNLNQCVQFLSGGNADWIGIRFGGAKESVVPVHIKNMMFQVLNLGNINSHSRTLNDDEQKKLGAYFKENVCNSQYLIYSLALQICEIAVFMGKYIATNKDANKNKSQCKTFGTVEIIEGNESICVIKSKRPGRESCICISAEYSTSKELIGKKVVVIEERKNNDAATKETYPYFAARVQSLEKENGSK